MVGTSDGEGRGQDSRKRLYELQLEGITSMLAVFIYILHARGRALLHSDD